MPYVDREEYNKVTALDLWGRFKERRKSKELKENVSTLRASIDLGLLSRSKSAPDGLQQQLRASKDMVAELKNENDRRLKQLDEIKKRYEGQVWLIGIHSVFYVSSGSIPPSTSSLITLPYCLHSDHPFNAANY